jgi:hypothetical protein
MASLSDVSPRIQAALLELVAAIEADTRASIQRLIGGEIALPAKRRGRPPKSAALAVVPQVQSVALAKKPRKKPPRQLCPVPGCKNTAAPVFGMVCAKHKDVPKAKIKEYREKRRAAKPR